MIRTLLKRFRFCKKVNKNIADIVDNYTTVSEGQRRKLVWDRAIMSAKEPQNAKHLSQLGDLTSYSVLIDLYERMQYTTEGSQILKDKPRVTQEIIEKYKLQELQDGTFGKTYLEYIKTNGFRQQQRPLVKYVPDLEYAYLLQRYNEIQDFLRILLIKEPSENDELILKWFQMTQLGLPSTALTAFVAPFLKGPAESFKFFFKEVPPIIQKANRCKFILSIYYEKYFSKDLSQFRKQIGLN